MKSLIKAIRAAFVLAIISGCTGYGVTFQSSPGVELSNCHLALVGDWRVIEGERNTPVTSSSDFLSINADCSQMIAVTSKLESGKRSNKVDNLNEGKEYSVQFSIGDTGDYVVVTPKESSVEITPEIKLPSRKIIYQINKGKDGVILRSVDLDKTAQLVLQKKISAQLFIDRDNPVSMNAYNIYVRGDSKQIASYLSTLDLYSNDSLLLVPASLEEVKIIRKAIKQNGNKK